MKRLWVLAIGAVVVLSSGAAGRVGAAACDVPSAPYPTIQSAVDDPACDVVNVAAGTFVENVVVGRNVTVQGQGQGSTVVDGNAAGSVFTIQAGLVVTLTQLTVTGGEAMNGAGIYNGAGSTLLLSGADVSGNTASGKYPDGRGGGIYNKSSLAVATSTFSANVANDSGGGIHNSGSLEVTDSTLTGNSAFWGYGGGIATEGGTVAVTNSTLNGNWSEFSDGGGIDNLFGSVTVSKSTFSENWAGYGGGIDNRGGSLTVADSTFDGNCCSGGGIFNTTPGSVTLTRSTFSGNYGSGVANGDDYSWGGGTVAVTDSTFIGNTATYGGGILGSGGSIQVTGSTLSGNMATFGGGGIRISGGSLALTDTIITGSSANHGAGIDNFSGTVVVTRSTVSGNLAYANGGGIRNFGSLTVGNSTINSNTADNGGGAYDNGGGIYNEGGSLEVTGSTLSGNAAGNSGGGIYNDYYGSLSLINSTVTGNSADFAGGIYNYGDAYGGTLLHSTIIASNASGDDCGGSMTSAGYNIDSDGTCNLTGPGDQPNTDPLIGPLADNGGPTWTHLPLAGSPAIDLGDPAECPPTDQRGIVRPQDGNGDGTAVCDVGAVEVEVPLLTMHVASIDPFYQPGGSLYRVGTSVTIQDGDDLPVKGARVRVRVQLPDGSFVSLQGTTRSNGQARVGLFSALSGKYIFTVTGVGKDGVVYDPSQNVETSDFITIP